MTFLQHGISRDCHTAVQLFSRVRILSRRGGSSSSSLHCVQPDTRRKPRSRLLQLDVEKIRRLFPTLLLSSLSMLPGWCCCCLLRSCVVPLWMTSCCSALSAHTCARSRLPSPDGRRVIRIHSLLTRKKVIQCSGCGVNRTRSAH